MNEDSVILVAIVFSVIGLAFLFRNKFRNKFPKEIHQSVDSLQSLLLVAAPLITASTLITNETKITFIVAYYLIFAIWMFVWIGIIKKGTELTDSLTSAVFGAWIVLMCAGGIIYFVFFTYIT